MFEINGKYKNAINNFNRTLSGYAKIIYNNNKWDYRRNPYILDDTKETICDDFNTFFTEQRAINYASLERDFFKLDGTFILPSNPNNPDYYWLKITKDRNFTIPLTKLDTENFIIYFDSIFEKSNTNFFILNGNLGGKVKISINDELKVKIEGTWGNSNVISYNTEDYQSQIILNKESTYYFKLIRKSGRITFDFSNTYDNTQSLGFVNSETIEKVSNIEFSQDNDVIQKISSIKIPSEFISIGYLGDGLFTLYKNRRYIPDLRYHYEFDNNNELEIKDLIEGNIAKISSSPEYEPKIYKNYNTGYISNTIGKAQINIILNQYTNKDGNDFTLYFNCGYPKSIIIKYYVGDDFADLLNEDNFIRQEIKDNTESIIHINHNFEGKYIKKIEIIIPEWSNSQHRVRLEKIDFEYTDIFENNRLVSIDVLEELSKFNEEEPDYSCEIKVDNYDRIFDYENDNGLFNKFGEWTRVIPMVGIVHDFIEYVPLGYFSYDKIENSTDMTTTMYFNGSKNYYSSSKPWEWQYGTEDKSLLNLIEDTIYSNDIAEEQPKLEVTNNFITNNLYSKSDNQTSLLQELCLASCSLLIQSRYSPCIGMIGPLYTKKIESLPKCKITLNQQKQYPKITKNSTINQIVATTKNIFNLSDDYTEIYNQKMKTTNESWSYVDGKECKNTSFVFFFKTSNPIDYENMKIYADEILIDGSTPLFEQYSNGGYYNHTVYIFSTGLDSSGNYSEKNLREEITVKIMARTYEEQDSSVTIDKEEITDNVVGFEYENSYLKDLNHHKNVANYIFENDFPYHAELQTIGDPSLRVGDLIDFETPFGYKRMLIEKQKITFDGGLSATLEGDCYDIKRI